MIDFLNIDLQNPENLDSCRIFKPTNQEVKAGTCVVFTNASDQYEVGICDEKHPYGIIRSDIVLSQVPSLEDSLFGIVRDQTQAEYPCNIVKVRENMLIMTDNVGSSITTGIIPSMPDGTPVVVKNGKFELASSYPTAPVVGVLVENKLGTYNSLYSKYLNGYVRIILKKV